MSKLSVLMTVYNEADYIEYAIRSCLPYVDHLVIVEGAYQETIKLGASPRSTDGTREILGKLCGLDKAPFVPQIAGTEKIHFIQANEQTDKDQRNKGLEKVKELNDDGWLLIIDGDEVYDENLLKMVKIASNTMDRQGKMAAYLKSLTFVNDFGHYCEQEFPRLFKLTPGAEFINDNFMVWKDKGITWFSPHIIKIPYIRYYHYAFCKGKDRFELKKKWWETRFGKPFDYGWHVNDSGKIDDESHEIIPFTGRHPEIMKSHPKWFNTEPPPPAEEEDVVQA